MNYRSVSSRFVLFSMMLAVLVVTAACAGLPPLTGSTGLTPDSTPSPVPGTEPTAPGPATGMPPVEGGAAVDAARDALAAELGLAVADVRVISVEEADWRDSCLEVSRPEVMCAQVIVPGYRITLEAGGQQYEMRTDRDGQRVVRAGPHATPGAPEGAAAKAMAQLASQLGLELNEVRFVSAERVEWSDACLGAGRPEEGCLQAITPGYRVVLEANNREYVFHTDETGSSIRPAPEGGASGEPGDALSIIGWRSSAEGCTDVFINRAGIRYGECGSELTAASFPTDTHRLEQIIDLEETYASFASDTPAGKVAFNGRGPLPAGPAEQRMVAEFAAVLLQEIQSGPGAAGYGMGWGREGGIAGFCDDLRIDASGHAVWRSCKERAAPDTAWRRLTEKELEQFYTWLDTLGQFEHSESDPVGAADAMSITVVFAGHTEKSDPPDADKRAMIQFGTQVLAHWAGPAETRYVQAQSDVPVYAGPGETFERLGEVAGGQTALVTGVSRDRAWWRVVCPDDTVGNCWVSADPSMTQPSQGAPGEGGQPPAPTEQPVMGTQTPATPAPGATPGTTGSVSDSVSDADQVAIYAAVANRIYTVDHTFSGSPNFPVAYLLHVDDSTKPASPFVDNEAVLDAEVERQVVEGLKGLPAKFTWVHKSSEIPRDAQGSIEGNGAVITMGNIRPQPDGTVQVASSIYVGMLAAGGQTYVLEKTAGGWAITGNTGSVWIS